MGPVRRKIQPLDPSEYSSGGFSLLHNIYQGCYNSFRKGLCSLYHVVTLAGPVVEKFTLDPLWLLGKCYVPTWAEVRFPFCGAH